MGFEEDKQEAINSVVGRDGMCNIIRAVYYSFSQDRLARLHGGTSTGEHCIGQSNRRYLVLEYDRAALGMVRAVKHAIDRDNIMNPGKILPDS